MLQVWTMINLNSDRSFTVFNEENKHELAGLVNERL